MKKLPIFLVSLSLVTSGMTMDVCSAYTTTGEETWRGENRLPDYLKVNTISLYRLWDQSGSGVSFSGDPKRREDSVWQLYLMTFDYRNGVTENEADRLIKEFRGEEADWVADRIVYRSEMEGASFSGTSWFSTNDSLTKDNRSGILYYAIETGSQEMRDRGETVWFQGKINYRGCLHDFWSLEENGRAGACYAREVGDGEVVYENSTKLSNDETPKTNEEAGAWIEEWAKVLVEEVEDLDKKLTKVLAGELIDGDDEDGVEDIEVRKRRAITRIETRALKIKEIAPKTLQEEAVTEATEALLARIRQWQNGQDKVTEIPTNPVTPVVKPGNLTTSVGGAAADASVDDGGDKSGNGAIRPGATQAISTTRPATAKGTANGSNTSAVEVVLDNETGQGEAEDTKKEIAQDSVGEEENNATEVEVPVLGNENGQWNWWPLIIAGCSIVGVALWCGKKWYDSRR